ncbi:hypothetical protein [Saccharomonospora sp. CUA-673]|uniref:hypothetical protein n=1 Tax=Saccharomonospora sp. CUA-673 TaxID=1904969 RepID=UPI0013019905|nr:hypothetical protein [Saccharomonospora sp. CUA-673]
MPRRTVRLGSGLLGVRQIRTGLVESVLGSGLSIRAGSLGMRLIGSASGLGAAPGRGNPGPRAAGNSVPNTFVAEASAGVSAAESAAEAIFQLRSVR